MHILVLNGPNLNLLGQRETQVYGNQTLYGLEQRLTKLAAQQQFDLSFKQSNHEGQLVDWIHQAKKDAVDFIVINAAAYTHTSVALRDALAAVTIPFVEVHISNVYAREEFRHHSFLADMADGVITGLGASGYDAACLYALEKMKQ